ncbi:MLX-interacting protein isoform X2 [Uranotaenia lowii]|nr:MLX-interacting protein isoform X2 [Uranotaenia lowii]
MKRRILVCQFASPLDVDIHNTPQAILLEGKYWKRKCNVIKAEYKKWRRYYVNKALGASNIVDTASELDFLEWSPNSNESPFMITDNMPTDTLFSTLAQYPFPDSREIARGANRADFIQPSLGPLQPNFDDLMDLDLDFLNFPRLATVPEEGSEDILRAIDYISPYVPSSTNSSSSIQEITDSLPSIGQSSSSSFVNRSSGSSVITGPATSGMNIDHSAQQRTNILNASSQPTIQYSAKIYSQNLNAPTSSGNTLATSGQTSSLGQQDQQQQQLTNSIGSYLQHQQSNILVNVPSASTVISSETKEDLNKDSKQKYSRSFLKHTREPHNYDKCPPTTHQTMAYNLVSQNPNVFNAGQYASNQFQVQQPIGIIQMPTMSNPNMLNYGLQMQHSDSPNNIVNLSGVSASGVSNSNLIMAGMNSNLLTHSQSLPVQNQLNSQKPQPRSISMPTAPNYPPMNSPPGALQHQDSFKGSLHPTSTSMHKSYHAHQPQPYKIPSQNIGPYGNTGRSMRHASPPQGHQQTQVIAMGQQPSLEQSQQQLQDLQLQQHQQLSPQSQTSQQQQQQQKRHPPHPTKEMFRSNSLPINATFPLPPKDETFAFPRPKPNPKLRSRSNSMIMKQATSSGAGSIMGISGTNLLPALHTTTSEPMLNSTSSALLAQLLTTNNTSTLLQAKMHSTSSSAIHNQNVQQQSSSHSVAQSQHLSHVHQKHSSANPTSPSSSQIQHQPSQSKPTSQHSPQPLLSFGGGNTSHSSVLSFASSSSTGATQSYSPTDTTMDQDAPMSLTSLLTDVSHQTGNTSPGSSGGAGHKFHLQQQQARSDSQRRSGHIHAEQKRRYNIKNGFDMLHSLIPQLQQNPNAKLSKAAMLQKGAEYIKQLRSERAATNEKTEALRREIEALNNSLSNLQTALPASGAPVSRQRTGRVKELYQQYVRQRTLDNWKFWIFGMIFEPLMNTFNQTVSVASLDEMCRTSQLWVDQHCSLVELRPAVSNKLRQLSTTTDILSDPPTSLQEEVLKAISSSMPLPGGGSSGSRGSSNANSPNRPNSSGMM